mgnify:CR=1 FL=1
MVTRFARFPNLDDFRRLEAALLGELGLLSYFITELRISNTFSFSSSDSPRSLIEASRFRSAWVRVEALDSFRHIWADFRAAWILDLESMVEGASWVDESMSFSAILANKLFRYLCMWY